jgi:hypothetical protein
MRLMRFGPLSNMRMMIGLGEIIGSILLLGYSGGDISGKHNYFRPVAEDGIGQCHYISGVRAPMARAVQRRTITTLLLLVAVWLPVGGQPRPSRAPTSAQASPTPSHRLAQLNNSPRLYAFISYRSSWLPPCISAGLTHDGSTHV